MKKYLAVLFFLTLFASGTSSVQAQSFYMQRLNDVGNWSTFIGNDGTFFNNSVLPMIPGGLWRDPTGFVDTLIFGGGIWVGAERRVNSVLQPAVSYGYEPNMGGDICVPGSTICDGPLGDTSAAGVSKYRVYLSRDQVEPPWPVRNTPVGPEYIDNVAARTTTGSPYVFGVSDLFAIYKDSDSSLYSFFQTSLPAGVEIRSQLSYWDEGDGRNVIVVHNAIIHTASDTLFNPVVGLALDGDINNPNDDRLKGVQTEGTHAAVFFTDRSRTDPFLGVVLLAGQHNARRQDPGMSALLYWDIDNDPKTDSGRYAFLSTKRYDTATSVVGDARLLMTSASTEPLVGMDTMYFDYALFAVASEGRPALDPLDSARVVSFANEIVTAYNVNDFGLLSVSGTSGDQSTEALRVYPNPAGRTATIVLPGGTRGSVSIYDELGREIGKRPFNQSAKYIDLDLTKYPTGTYFLSIDGSGKATPFQHRN